VICVPMPRASASAKDALNWKTPGGDRASSRKRGRNGLITSDRFSDLIGGDEYDGLAVTVPSGVAEKNVAAIDETYGTRLDEPRDLLELANSSRLAQDPTDAVPAKGQFASPKRGL